MFRAELETIRNNLKTCNDELAKLLDDNRKLESNETSAKNIQSDVIMIDSYYNDISRYTIDEQRLVKKIGESGFTRDLQAAINEQKSLKSTLNDICNAFENKQYKLTEYNETLYKLQADKNNITTDELNINSKIQDKIGAQEKLNELYIVKTALSLALNNAVNTVEPIRKKLEEHIKVFEETKKLHNEIIANNRKDVLSYFYHN